MIAGQMRIPWVPVDNARIARRHAHSIALAAYFRESIQRDPETWKKRTASGLASSSSTGCGRRITRCASAPLPDPGASEVDGALRRRCPDVQAEIGVQDGSWVHELVDQLVAVQNEVSKDIEIYNEQIDEAARERKFGLGKRLARRCARSKAGNCWDSSRTRTSCRSTGSQWTPWNCARFTHRSQLDVTLSSAVTWGWRSTSTHPATKWLPAGRSGHLRVYATCLAVDLCP